MGQATDSPAFARTYDFMAPHHDQQEAIMTGLEIGKKYVALCKEGKFDECISALFAPNAVSVEAGAPPGQDRTAKGIDAIRAKSKWWADNHTVHKAEHSGPYPHDDRFTVRFTYDVTNKQNGQRFTMDEIGLFTVKDGKIVREEFFYSMS
jgi:ketosteroid isomerase-like protein